MENKVKNDNNRQQQKKTDKTAWPIFISVQSVNIFSLLSHHWNIVQRSSTVQRIWGGEKKTTRCVIMQLSMRLRWPKYKVSSIRNQIFVVFRYITDSIRLNKYNVSVSRRRRRGENNLPSLDNCYHFHSQQVLFVTIRMYKPVLKRTRRNFEYEW